MTLSRPKSGPLGMRVVFLFLIGLLVGACVAQAPAKEPAPTSSHVDSASELAAETVALVLPIDPARAFCSGVWVSNSEIMTAAHCVSHDDPASDDVDYVMHDDVYPIGAPVQADRVYRRQAVVTLRDPAHDIALLQASEPVPFHTTPMLGDSIRQGQSVQTMGHSLGLWFSFSSGEVAAIRTISFGDDDDEIDPNTVWVQSTAPVSMGNSGGGLFDENGSLIGICSRLAPRGQNVNLYVHRNHLAALIAKAHGH